MAIDTAEKRRAAGGVSVYFNVFVTPNSSKDDQWRWQSGYNYSGVLADGGRPFSPIKVCRVGTLMQRR